MTPGVSTHTADALAAWLRERTGPEAMLHSDSRTVRPGDAFIACAGLRGDGRDYIAAAISAGARAVLWQADAADNHRTTQIDAVTRSADVAARGVQGLRALAGDIASAFNGHPSRALQLVAVTGTNGKTSCTHWIAQGCEADAMPAAVIGTLGSGRIGALDGFGLTTPDATTLHRMLAGLVAQGVGVAAIEASSIGLHQGRLDGASVAAAVFTNLTHDHLDYHGTMQAYGQAKAMLFARPGLRTAVVNLDDAASASMLAALAQGGSPAALRIGYTLRGLGRTDAPKVDATLVAEAIVPHAEGLRVALAGDFGRAQVDVHLIGRFNVANALAVAATWLGLGVPFDRVLARLRGLQPVRGRLQRVGLADDSQRVAQPMVLVDYAHTPDALENVLGALRDVAQARGGKLWCVFGAGGDRDRAKRPAMARVAQRLADRIVITSDNPRSESPAAIMADVMAGLAQPAHAVREDRAQAIADAIVQAGVDDVVLIAGKGHETWQEIGGRRLPFDDAQQARTALRHRLETSHG